MSAYLDASVVVALFAADTMSPRAVRLAASIQGAAFVSDFAAVEFASAIARKVRTGEIGTRVAPLIFTAFDAWRAASTRPVVVQTHDFATATSFLRRLDLSLRAPDAINVAIAHRLRVPLATLDARMAADAAFLGVAVLPETAP